MTPRRRRREQAILELKAIGASQIEISRVVQCHRNTVSTFLKTDKAKRALAAKSPQESELLGIKVEEIIERYTIERIMHVRYAREEVRPGTPESIQQAINMEVITALDVLRSLMKHGSGRDALKACKIVLDRASNMPRKPIHTPPQKDSVIQIESPPTSNSDWMLTPETLQQILEEVGEEATTLQHVHL